MAITKITTPELFDFSATNTALQLPTGTTAQRPTSPSAGQWRYNTTEKYVEYWDGSAWKQIDTEALPLPADFPGKNFNTNTYFGTGASQTIDAKFNEAANFNGSSSHIDIGDVIPNTDTDYSVSTWINIDSGFTSGNRTILGAASSSSGTEGSFRLQLTYVSANTYKITIARTVATSGTNFYYSSSWTASSINTGQWYNIVATYNSTGRVGKTYLNGAAVDSSALTTSASVSSVNNDLIGGQRTNTAKWLGKIDQVRIFNTAITPQQVTDLYNNETTDTAGVLNFPAGAGCIAAYQLDGDASDVGGTYGGVPTDIGYTGLQFQPDLVWVKVRTNTYSHTLSDSVRGDNKALISDGSNSEYTDSDFSISSNGFSMSGNGVMARNVSGQDYVAWCWKAADTTTTIAAGTVGNTIASDVRANQDAGFSIVEYTANATSGATIGHGLNEELDLLIVKSTNLGQSWNVYVKDVTDTNAKYLRLNQSDGILTTVNPRFIVGNFNSDVFSVGNDNSTNGVSGTDQYIAYCFHSVDNYQKIGSYIGTGTAGNNVVTDFEPAFLMVKAAIRPSGGGSWYIFDNKRTTSNPQGQYLQANESAQEFDGTSVFDIDFQSNGFTVNGTNNEINQSGSTYIYLAIAADPQPAPVLANSFQPLLYTGNGGTQNIQTDFKPDLMWIKDRDGSESHQIADSVRGVPGTLSSSSTGQNYIDPTYQYRSINSNGFTLKDVSQGFYAVNGNAIDYVAWNWKAAGISTINNKGTITSITNAHPEAGFSIVKWTSTSSSSDTIGHGLSSKPEVVLYKKTSSTGSWFWYTDVIDGSWDELILNSSAAKSDFAGTYATSDTFKSVTSSSGADWITYCFHSVTGYQKVGKYSSTGATGVSNQITTGFRPRFLLVKSYSDPEDWYIFDSQRINLSGSNDGLLFANTNAAENTGFTRLEFTNTGWYWETAFGGNSNGYDYIYLAIA